MALRYPPAKKDKAILSLHWMEGRKEGRLIPRYCASQAWQTGVISIP